MPSSIAVPADGSNRPEKLQKKAGQCVKRRRKRRIAVLLSIAVLIAAAVVTFLLMYSGIRLQYIVELGNPIPAADAYAKSSSVPLAYITDVSAIDASKTGSHLIHISADGKERIVLLTIRDTTAPQAQPVEISISVAQQLAPDQLVSNLTDADSVKLQWDNTPAFGTAGDYTVVISMKDLSGNKSSVTSVVHIRAVKDSVACEAGSQPPMLADFLVDASLSASFVTDVASLSLDTPGNYPVDIIANGVAYTSVLTVVDTVAPVVTMKALCIEPGSSATPEDFVDSAADASALTYEFDSEPDFNSVGTQDVRISITDLGGNSITESAVLLVSHVTPITVEARNTGLTAEDFNVAGYASVALSTQIVPDTPGVRLVELLLDGEVNPTMVTVVDTTPPQGEGVDAQWYLSHPIPASQLVANGFDCTGFTCAYEAEPDWAKTGTQSVTVVLTDAAGNTAQVTSTLTLSADTQAPNLYGVRNRYCYIGQAVAYFAEVFAEDNCDGEVPVDVDNTQVNIYAAGTYPVSYTATDSSGNSVTLSCEFTFVDETITDETLNAAVDAVLAEITTSDMSIGYKAYAIYKYVFGHIKYNGVSNKTDWRYEAYRGITTGRGDCFTFYATAKCLLERIGAQTMCVERYGGKNTHHYWLLVNLGTGWYHLDTINVGPRNWECFMRTTEDLLARSTYFWSFDQSKYPPTPTEDYVLE